MEEKKDLDIEKAEKSERAERRDYSEDVISLVRAALSPEELKESLEEYHDNDIANALEELTDEEVENLFTAIGNEAASDVLTYVEDAGEYLSELDADAAADIIEQMDADEAVEILDELDEEKRAELLGLIEDGEVKEDIELLGSYDEDEFGSKMSRNFIAVERGLTIKKAMRALICEAAENDNIYTLFAVNEDGSFYGAVDLKDLIVARSEDSFEDLICTTFPFVYDKDVISENIERVRSYSEDLIPVLSAENNVLLGVITSKDITEIVDEERGDDYAKLAALASEEEKDDSLIKSMGKRVPWLVVLLLLGLAVSAVVGLFEGIVDELPMIVAFQSLILGMAGNVGTQSLAVTVRAIGSDDGLGARKQLSIIAKETRIALLNGVALGLISFLIVGAYLAVFGSYTVGFALSAAGCVGAAMFFAMMISGFFGAAIPLCFYRLGVDPAVASGPLITTVNDLVAVVSYYGLAWLLLIRIV